MSSRIVRALAPARPLRGLVAVALLGFGTSSCDVHGLSEPGTLSNLDVTPDPTSLAVGTTRQFTATGSDFSGATVVVDPIWSVVSGGGSISTTGLFTAGTLVGSYVNTVQVTSNGKTATATVAVTAGPLARIIVAPTPVTLATGATQQYTAVGQDASGNAVAITPTWAVVAGGGTLSNAGLFTAGTVAGTYTNTVQASSGGIAGNATVIVPPGALASVVVTPDPVNLAQGATQQFTAAGRDANGNAVAITPVWSVVAGGGSIDATGSFTAGTTPGTYTNTVRATSGTLSGFATVTVTPGAVATIVVSPNPASVPIGGQQQFSAVGRDANGNVVTISPAWSVVAGGGSIDATGRFTAGTTPGTYTNTVRATSGTVSGFATVTVTPGAVATIVVSPNPETLGTGEQQQFSAEGRDANGNVVTIVPTWAIVNGGGSIGQTSGVFTAGTTAGTFPNTVRASVGTVAGFATVTVTTAAPPPPSPSILGSAASNGIMAGTAVTCVIGGTIFADVSISPGNTITGFPPCSITGVQNLANAVAAQMQIDLTAAYNTLAAMPCPPANFITSNLGGTTKPAGVYCSATGIGVTGTLTLDGGGDPNAMFVFQAGTGLTTAGNVVLINGARASNVYWLVGSSATIGTASQWQGNIVALTSITLVDNANLFGRALARNGAVSLGTGNTITLP